MEPKEGHVTLCPSATITFTCSEIAVYGIIWFAHPLLNEDNSPALGTHVDIGTHYVVEDVFTITLVAREVMIDSLLGNYTSTLDVVVNDVIQNGTNITCITPNIASFLLFKQGITYQSRGSLMSEANLASYLVVWKCQQALLYRNALSTP